MRKNISQGTIPYPTKKDKQVQQQNQAHKENIEKKKTITHLNHLTDQNLHEFPYIDIITKLSFSQDI